MQLNGIYAPKPMTREEALDLIRKTHLTLCPSLEYAFDPNDTNLDIEIVRGCLEVCIIETQEQLDNVTHDRTPMTHLVFADENGAYNQDDVISCVDLVIKARAELDAQLRQLLEADKVLFPREDPRLVAGIPVDLAP